MHEQPAACLLPFGILTVMIRLVVFMLCFSAAPLYAQSKAVEVAFDPGTIDYDVRFDGLQVRWNRFAVFVMPGEVSELELGQEPFGVTASAGTLERIAPGRWRWTAPGQAGLARLSIAPASGPPTTLNVIVQVPAGKAVDGYLNGYRIGAYPQTALRGNAIYLPPPGFIQVHPDMLDLAVSPHFTLGQFLCKQQPDHWPKYLVLREELVVKLEIILAEVNRRGIRTDTLHVMSGYRTPWYNRSIGNVPYSRHVWGGAADIFVDTDGDDRMDDLNHDGRVGTRDARVLLGIVNDLYRAGRFERLVGGLGLYGPRSHRGPFVHVDARGEAARWETP